MAKCNQLTPLPFKGLSVTKLALVAPGLTTDEQAKEVCGVVGGVEEQER